ncbi:MAG: cytochrome c oxidase assembly protein [Rubrivivax sp.]|nr:cytochrome c oxidase assembly protein [Rubrivivax sp.]
MSAVKLLMIGGGALFAAMASNPAWAHTLSLDKGVEQAPVWLAQALLVVAWISYTWGAMHRRPATGPRLAFHTAMAIAAVALFGPLDTLAESSSAWHMVQHMLLIVVVAPLAVLARPLPQWRAVLGGTADALWRGLHRISRHPMRVALLHAAALWFWHAPGPYIAAVQNPTWHVLEHACFLFSGWLFWWAVLRPGRTGALQASLALLLTVMHTGLLGALLTFSRMPMYHTGPAALADQQLAGLVMWIAGGLVYLLATVWAAWRWLHSMETPTLAAPQRPRGQHPGSASFER